MRERDWEPPVRDLCSGSPRRSGVETLPSVALRRIGPPVPPVMPNSSSSEVARLSRGWLGSSSSVLPWFDEKLGNVP